MKKFFGMGLASAAIACLTMSLAAEAVEIRVRCDYRGEARRERTKVSVDAKDLAPGTYQAIVEGSASPLLTVTPPFDEFEADFDSNRGDIRAGASPLAASDGQDEMAVVQVLQGQAELFWQAVPCPGEVRQTTP